MPTGLHCCCSITYNRNIFMIVVGVYVSALEHCSNVKFNKQNLFLSRLSDFVADSNSLYIFEYSVYFQSVIKGTCYMLFLLKNITQLLYIAILK